MSQKESSEMAHDVPSIAKNFPESTTIPSVIFKWPGVTHASTLTARKVLTENDHKYDIYEGKRFAHNHFPHSLLTRFALGGPSKLLQDVWNNDKKHLVSLDPTAKDRKVDMDKIPDKITRENWDDPKYLGYDGVYSRYLAFFHSEIDRLGPFETFREYVLTPRANWEGHKPRMALRIMGGFYHPFIHAGFGVEFRDRIVLAEGLAEACVHKIDLFENLLPPDYPRELLTNPSSTVTNSAQSDPTSVWSQSAESSNSHRSPKTGKSLLEIFAEVYKSDTLTPIPYDPKALMRDRMLGAVEGKKGAELWRLAGQWSLEDDELRNGPEGWEKKVEEVAILATFVACATGKAGKEGRVDFFLMHALTSSIFLPSFLPLLNISERRVLLQTYVTVTLQFAISRGKPAIDSKLLMSLPLYPVPKESDHTSNGVRKAKDAIADPENKETSNKWLSIVESSLYAYDSHVPKAIRSLLHWSSLYGSTPAGGFIGAFNQKGEESLPGMGKADGTIFIRGAGLVMDCLGWCREGESEGSWDFSGLGYDESWEGAGKGYPLKDYDE